MAVTSVVVLQGTTKFIVDVTWGADADTDSANIPHGLGAAPLEVSIAEKGTNTIVPGIRVKTLDATNLMMTKIIVAAGSLNAVARVTLSIPHTLTR